MKNTYKSGVKPHICFIAHYYIPDEASTEAIQSFSYLYASVSSNVSNSNRPKYRNSIYNYEEKVHFLAFNKGITGSSMIGESA